MNFAGKVAIVTGASSGIGAEAARAFARRGATVVGVARREELLAQLTEELRRDAPNSSYLCGDLGEREFAEHAVDDTVRRHGRLDILVNNAAIPKHKHIYHVTPEEAERVMRINFLSAVWTSLAALRPMLTQEEGFIVNVSSIAAKVVPPREAIYAASKAAMNSFTESLWSDLAGSNIHAALIHTGPIDTEIWQKMDEPPGYEGRRHPPRVVVDAIFEAIEKRRFEVTAPRWSLPLAAARLLRGLAPSLVRWATGRMEPVPDALIEAARARAREEARLG
jgi:NAD(P)-dependent dehydrogenase (short-subunit alcohol dehydrogenase family)